VRRSLEAVHGIPRLTTERLVLRGLREDDLDAYAAAVGDPEVMAFVGRNRPLSRGEAWREIAMFLGGWALHGLGQWAVERRADGMLLGRAGLWHPPDWPGLEVGWVLGRAHWGQGYATEAGGAAVAWAGDVDLVSLIAPGNARSVRVAAKLGFAYDRPLGAADVYARPAPGPLGG